MDSIRMRGGVSLTEDNTARKKLCQQAKLRIEAELLLLEIKEAE